MEFQFAVCGCNDSLRTVSACRGSLGCRNNSGLNGCIEGMGIISVLRYF